MTTCATTPPTDAKAQDSQCETTAGPQGAMVGILVALLMVALVWTCHKEKENH